MQQQPQFAAAEPSSKEVDKEWIRQKTSYVRCSPLLTKIKEESCQIQDTSTGIIDEKVNTLIQASITEQQQPNRSEDHGKADESEVLSRKTKKHNKVKVSKEERKLLNRQSASTSHIRKKNYILLTHASIVKLESMLKHSANIESTPEKKPSSDDDDEKTLKISQLEKRVEDLENIIHCYQEGSFGFVQQPDESNVDSSVGLGAMDDNNSERIHGNVARSISDTDHQPYAGAAGAAAEQEYISTSVVVAPNGVYPFTLPVTRLQLNTNEFFGSLCKDNMW